MANLNKIRDLSHTKKISLAELARRIEISQQGMQRLLKENTTSIDTLEKISKVLGVPVGYFFDEDVLIGGGIMQNGHVNIAGNGNGAVKIEDCRRELSEARREIEYLKREVATLSKLIKMYEDKDKL